MATHLHLGSMSTAQDISNKMSDYLQRRQALGFEFKATDLLNHMKLKPLKSGLCDIQSSMTIHLVYVVHPYSTVNSAAFFSLASWELPKLLELTQ